MHIPAFLYVKPFIFILLVAIFFRVSCYTDQDSHSSLCFDRAAYACQSSVENMRLDHRRPDIFMTREFLDGSYVVTAPPADASRRYAGMYGRPRQSRMKCFILKLHARNRNGEHECPRRRGNNLGIKVAISGFFSFLSRDFLPFCLFRGQARAELSIDPVERLAVEAAYAAVGHAEPQGVTLVPIDGPHLGAGQPVLHGEVRQRLAIEAPRTVVACAEPDVAGGVFRNREDAAERAGRPLLPDTESVLFGKVGDGLSIIVRT